MDKEKITEELVRQNGNQAAAVMADYASQGGSAGSISFVDFTKLFPNMTVSEETDEDEELTYEVHIFDMPDGFYAINPSSSDNAYLVKNITNLGSASVDLAEDGTPSYINCEPVKLQDLISLGVFPENYSFEDACIVSSYTSSISGVHHPVEGGTGPFRIHVSYRAELGNPIYHTKAVAFGPARFGEFSLGVNDEDNSNPYRLVIRTKDGTTYFYEAD